MAEEKTQSKPFAGGILIQTTGRPGDTVQRSFDREVVKGRPGQTTEVKPPAASGEKRG
jgi:hypothetical protein